MHQPRETPAPVTMIDVGNHGRRLRRHSPVFIVETPPSSYGYAFVVSPRIRGCGVVTRRTPLVQGFPDGRVLATAR